jgi:hypothetical protein
MQNQCLIKDDALNPAPSWVSHDYQAKRPLLARNQNGSFDVLHISER